MTGIKSKVVIAAAVGLAAVTACSSGPTPMQKWEAGPGFKAVPAITAAENRITADANATGQVPQADADALSQAATRGYDNCPPVDCAQWKQAMKDYLAAGIAITLARVTGNTADYTTAADEIGNATAIINRLRSEWGLTSTSAP